MAKINLLTSDVFNRISAGEVVERPKSVVKELVENSIDAGATNITVEIVDGGITMVKISDNGSGIENEYVESAFLPHATSKVEKYDDLDTIATLGFRGEALASIASVSNVELTTRYVDEQIGTFLELRGGEKVKHTPCDRDAGTTIIVRNLFFNTPARQKFLKKAKSEEADITAVMQGLIVSNPDIAIKYFADGKCIYTSNGRGLENAVYSIYPTTITKHLTYFEHTVGNISVHGYISTPELTKGSRNYQTTIVNGRLIKNQIIDVAVMKAYGNRLMKRAFPVFVLDIVMPFDSLDINVTPSKTDVRFIDERAVFSAVYHSVEYALANANNIFHSTAPKEDVPVIQNNEITNPTLPKIEVVEKKDNILEKPSFNYEKAVNLELNEVEKPVLEQKKQENTVFENNNETDKKPAGFVKSVEKAEQKTEDTRKTAMRSTIQDIMNIKASEKISVPSPSTLLKVCDSGYSAPVNREQIKNVQTTLFDDIEEELSFSDSKVLGQIFSTYILVTKANNLYIIDQHAAHEKMLYDKLIKGIKDKELIAQPLLTPQIVQLSAVECDYINDYLDDFAKIGLVMEEFGDDTFKISSIPTILKGFNAEKFINLILADKYKFSQIKLEELLHEQLAVTACKAAIKGGMQLKDIEINALIKDIEQNKPIQCPHGRPTIVKMSKTDIDKMFKRIL